MNCLKQLDNGIISSLDDLNVLAEKKEVKILVASDSHGRASVLRQIVLKYGENCDALIFAGDGIGDLISILNESKTDENIAKCVPPVVAFVRGNNDPMMYPVNFDPFQEKNDYSYFNIRVPSSVVFKIAGRNVFVTHGHKYGVYYSNDGIVQAAEEVNCNVAIFGHTHFPYEELQRVYMMNPGSLSYPRSRSKPGFAFLNITPKEIYTVFFKTDSYSATDFEPYNPELY